MLGAMTKKTTKMIFLQPVREGISDNAFKAA
jgi:hypothetical protein